MDPLQKPVLQAPKTQKALNNQGLEYGGSVEIRTIIKGSSLYPA